MRRQFSNVARRTALVVASFALSMSWVGISSATPFFFSTGAPDGKIATASRPGVSSFEIESADDFILTNSTLITRTAFTGLLTNGATAADISDVVVEIYRVFPRDSDVGRTSGPPTFSTPNVPTRVNSPSDVALDSRDLGVAGDLTFTTTDLGTFTASNSVQPGGIHAKPGQTTGGDGPVTGDEVVISVNLTRPFLLAPGHYFFVPQVDVTSGRDFLWLSAPKPIVAPGTPFLPDLQSWTRDQFLDPDWLRVGTDIVGGTPAPTFNAAFTLNGAIPEPASLILVAAGLLAVWWTARKRKK